MSTTTAQRRKGGGPPRSQDGVTNVAVPLASDTTGPVKVATVRRRKYGTSPFDENWLNVDCCGLFCAGFTYMLHLYGVYAVCLVLLPPWMSTTDEDGIRSLTLSGHFNRLAFTTVAVMAIYSHFRAMTTDPGAVPPDATPLEEPEAPSVNEETDPVLPPRRRGKKLCRRCNAFKPARAHHCSVCKRCIIKMDHHCPWVNNCVGIGNHKYFLLFVFYTFVSCAYSISLVSMRFWSCMHVRHGRLRSHATCLDHPSQLLSILGLLVEGILFGLFTSCMIIDQSSVVTTKLTHIDRLKGEVGNTGVAGIIEVFGMNLKRNTGSKFRPDWLSPFANVCFPPTVRDEIFGFCRPCTRSKPTSGSDKEIEMNGSQPQQQQQQQQPSTSNMIRSVTEIV